MFRTIACMCLFVASAAVAEEKYKADDLVGTWELASSTNRNAPKSMKWTLNKDGSFAVEITLGKDTEKNTGKWKLEGDKISITLDGIDKPGKMPILKLTSDTLVTKDIHGDDTCKKAK